MEILKSICASFLKINNQISSEASKFSIKKIPDSVDLYSLHFWHCTRIHRILNMSLDLARKYKVKIWKMLLITYCHTKVTDYYESESIKHNEIITKFLLAIIFEWLCVFKQRGFRSLKTLGNEQSPAWRNLLKKIFHCAF